MMIRLDRVLVLYQIGTRTEVKNLIRSKRVLVNNQIVTKVDHKVVEDDSIRVNQYKFNYHEFETYMMNKQKNRICSHDSSFKTIYHNLDFIYPSNLSTIGRLDKDTTGLLILTNDGNLNHRITSKHNQSVKRYLVTLKKPYLNETLQNVNLEKDGIVSAKSIEIINDKQIIIGITDGKYHQVKRMIHSINNEVLELHRLSIGSLQLDPSLKVGEIRPLLSEEIRLLYV